MNANRVEERAAASVDPDHDAAVLTGLAARCTDADTVGLRWAGVAVAHERVAGGVFVNERVTVVVGTVAGLLRADVSMGILLVAVALEATWPETSFVAVGVHTQVVGQAEQLGVFRVAWNRRAQ